MASRYNCAMNFKEAMTKFSDAEYKINKAKSGVLAMSSTPYQTATSYIKKANVQFMEITKTINKRIKEQIGIHQKDPLIDLHRGNSFLGTMIDEYFLAKFDEEDLSDDELLIKTKIKIMYRSLAANFDNTNDDEIINAFHKIKPILDDEILQLENVVSNPVFGNDILMADGDMIIGGVITELKFSSSKTFKVGYLRQLITYMYLNKRGNLFNVDYSKIGIIMPNYKYKKLDIDLERAMSQCNISLEELFEMIDDDLENKRKRREEDFRERSIIIDDFSKRLNYLRSSLRRFSRRKNIKMVSQLQVLIDGIPDGYIKSFLGKDNNFICTFTPLYCYRW